MPCYDPETHDRPVRLENKVHRLTAMLCDLCGKIEKTNPALIAENRDLAEWWKDHKTHDERIAALEEKRRLHGDAALTPEERGTLYCANDVSY